MARRYYLLRKKWQGGVSSGGSMRGKRYFLCMEKWESVYAGWVLNGYGWKRVHITWYFTDGRKKSEYMRPTKEILDFIFGGREVTKAEFTAALL